MAKKNPNSSWKAVLYFLNNIIIDIYLGSSTHPKVAFREVLHPIKLEFGNIDFWGEGKPENPEKNLSEQSKEPTRATRVGGECNHHYAISAPLTCLKFSKAWSFPLLAN